MNIDLARTFLEIVETGNFNKAAERLDITQSTVSMRIKALEDELGRPLFIRSKTGTGLTAAGLQFRRYAASLVRVWEQARQEIALPPGFRTVLNVGGQFSLWDRLLVQWIPWMRTALPDVALRAEVGLSDGLMRQLSEGMLDIGVMYSPQSRPGLHIEKLLDERLVMVSTKPRAVEEWDEDYVFVDWGPEFRQGHGQAFPDLKTPAVSVGLGALGLQHVLAHGGTSYFPMRTVRSYLAAGRLFEVTGAPDFRRPAWLVYSPDDGRGEWFRTALEGLRYVASLESED
ncbi:LysR family transcriptional regulator [Magnetospirillum moscoviense]|uniref:LysR family transcriptional regulator n=1 Tax=Magnetospirillum moscoviense TaxID=1437059 RepID=A0A178MA96_9PROT|nr:LysR family transcriptional regulator [Magnetospirillum moscoviense]MBF0325365.1 LysR family transcriptional regulator [Alphaproteobacteria bacterium]OAN45117.1 LysR family transcriptional regulator [Magnetospirillum moscoviense]